MWPTLVCLVVGPAPEEEEETPDAVAVLFAVLLDGTPLEEAEAVALAKDSVENDAGTGAGWPAPTGTVSI